MDGGANEKSLDRNVEFMELHRIKQGMTGNI